MDFSILYGAIHILRNQPREWGIQIMMVNNLGEGGLAFDYVINIFIFTFQNYMNLTIFILQFTQFHFDSDTT